ncbi:hypothetical protein M3Y99_01075800 [Aphelenchoides fujianensis]|nr:hypothetical protein M3Y99_01075800 [Aphelenchoides fujianensis]
MDPKLVRSDRTWDQDARPQWKAGRSSSSGQLLTDFEGPLGFRAGVVLPVRGDFSAFLRYALESDRFVDEFADTGYGHNASSPHFRYDMNLSIEEAIFLVPRRLANRTKMIWKPNAWVTGEEFPRVLVLADYVETGLEYYDNVVEAFKAARLDDGEFAFLRMLVFFSPVPGLSAKRKELVRETHDYYQSLFIRYLLSKHDRQTALKRMAELLTLLPLIEQAANTAINYASKTILFNYSESQGNLMFEMQRALTSRLSIA